MSAGSNSVISEDQAKEVITMLIKREDNRYISEKLGININIVNSIRVKHSWKWLTEEFEFDKSKRSSKYIGVSRHSHSGKYQALCDSEYLGIFSNEIEAAKRYDYVCWNKYHDLSKLNFPDDCIQQILKPLPIQKKESSTSKYLGVCRKKNDKKWTAFTKINGKSIYIGRFVTELDAAIAYDEFSWNKFHDLRRLNFPGKSEALESPVPNPSTNEY